MPRPSKSADVARALEEAARVASKGEESERAGRFEESAPEPDDEATTGDEIAMYHTERGVNVELRFSGTTLWATQKQMADLFGITQASVSRHLKNVFAEGELEDEATYTENVYVVGQSREYRTRVYGLDAIISVGYRVSSKQGTMFRRWATDKLVQFAIKGFALDDERLKSPEGADYFAELRERIRDIRASESNVYKELRAICSLCSDYDPKSKASKNYFAAMQNKVLWAVTSMTAPQIILERARSDKGNMGLVTWKGREVTKADVLIAKNYLGNAEITELNRLTTMLLDYLEDRTSQRSTTAMADLEEALDQFIKFNERPLLKSLGTVRREQADAHAAKEYETFSEARRLERQEAGDRAVAELVKLGKKPKRTRTARKT